jgi:transcriptional regulator with XRE-family HTH domain
MLAINLSSPGDIITAVGRRAKSLRLLQNLTQEGLAARAAVSLGTLRLFERSGKASLETVIKIAFALGAEQEFEALFPPQQVVRIEDVVEKPPRRRGRRK